MVDAAGLLPAQRAAQAFEPGWSDVERQSKHQFVVVTVKSLGGHDIADYGRNLGRYLGHRPPMRNDDGVLLIVAPNERKVRIEVGYGLEKGAA